MIAGGRFLLPEILGQLASVGGKLPIFNQYSFLERPWWCNSPYFAFLSPNSIAMQANYVTVVEDRPIMSIKYCLPVPVFYFWPKTNPPCSTPSLWDSRAPCYSASALLAMQSAVLARGILSVCPSVRHVPVLCKTIEDTIMRFQHLVRQFL